MNNLFDQIKILKSNKHIDNDFLTLCAAKHVILERPSEVFNGGHFAKLITMVRDLIT